MLEIGLLIGATIGFYNWAKKNGLNPILYAVLTVVSYFAGAFLLGVIMGAVNPYFLQSMSQIELSLYGILAGACGIGMLYLTMVKAAKNKREKSPAGHDELIDSESHYKK